MIESGEVKVAIGLAATDFVHTFFAYDYAGLMANTLVARPQWQIARLVSRGSLIPQQRELITDATIDGGFTHVLFVDSDMRFPKDALVRLVEHDLPIVGAGYTDRHKPYKPQVIKHLDTDERVYTTREKEGVEQVAALGFGCILIRRDALEKIDRPRFTVGWSQSDAHPNGAHVGEDIFFCFKAGKASVPIYVDHDLTRDVKHIGEYEYTFESALSMRDMDSPLIVPGV